MTKPRIYADFNNADNRGRVRLNCAGTAEDLQRLQLSLREGMLVTLYADDLNAQGELDELFADGSVTYSNEESCWVALIDWKAVRHRSDENATANGAIPTSKSSLSN